MGCNGLPYSRLLIDLPWAPRLLSQGHLVTPSLEEPLQLYNFANLVYHLVNTRYKHHEALHAGIARVNFNFKDRVSLYTADARFVVQRDIIVAGSLYFDACFRGGFAESYSGKVYFNTGFPDHDVSTEDLLSYLWLAHEYFFTNLLSGDPPCFERCRVLIDRTARKYDVEVPSRTMTSTVATLRIVDRFLHGPLLPVCRRLVLENMVFTRQQWWKTKTDLPDFSHPIHEYFMRDFLKADALLRPAWECASMIRDALIESFFYLVCHNEEMRWYLMPIIREDPEFHRHWSNFSPRQGPYKVWGGTWAYFLTDEHLTIQDITDALHRRSLRVFGNPDVELSTVQEAARQAATDEHVARAIARVDDLVRRDAEAKKNRKRRGKAPDVEDKDRQLAPGDKNHVGRGPATAEGSEQKKKWKWKKKKKNQQPREEGEYTEMRR
ncbi:hypothetical protein SODALDRAFT_357850 [Sodiomyces alkalinus F11]|uniref:BTB domain-containing protein n=1 Tax=Sodiomyces alkalinus (strain CBS 110278 / VKM F-3762 / F11) TaxID=1314773 RepID=A0A3N2Q4Y7_SODAK|nr:hypothetical protein SODALDRAFT_357850 [Sodiomyces alkalinus F11]ROT41766.1 hypothetical protein SODALDRAFT_357850 [Sodiomyces alkalinus F11]